METVFFVIAYLAVAIVTTAFIMADLQNDKRRWGISNAMKGEDFVVAGLGGFFWPVVLPVALVAFLANVFAKTIYKTMKRK